MDIKTRTIDMIHRYPGPMRELAARSGVGYEWLKKLKHGHLSDPGVIKVERVYRYLNDYEQRAA